MTLARLLRRPALARLLAWLLALGFTLAASAQPAPAPPPLSLVVLGSGGPGATGRAGSSHLVLVHGTPRILVDAGPGAFVRLGEARLSLAKVDVVLLTHLHIDHAGGLPGLFKARAVAGGGPIKFQVFGPDARQGTGDDASFPSTRRFIDLLFGSGGAFGYLRDFSAPMTIQATDIPSLPAPDAAPVTIYTDGDLVVTAIAGHHRDAPAVIYRVDFAGKSITFSGDIDADGLPDLRRIARGTGLLVFNSVVLDPPGSPPVLYTLHTPPKTIGEIAAGARVGKLLLSHLSPTTDNARDAITASIAAAYKGTTLFAEDGMRVAP